MAVEESFQGEYLRKFRLEEMAIKSEVAISVIGSGFTAGGVDPELKKAAEDYLKSIFGQVL